MPASTSARGARVVLPAPGGASATGFRSWRTAVTISGNNASIGNESTARPQFCTASDEKGAVMITVRRASERGHENYGWLDTHHTFSFGDYHDARQMGFRSLRVINEDFVEAGA